MTILLPILLGFSLWCVSPVYAQAVTLSWDRNPDTDQVVQYQVYSCLGMTCADTALLPVPNGIVAQPTAPAVPSWAIPDGFIGRLAVTAMNIAWVDTSVTPNINVYNESDKSISIAVNAKRGAKPTNPKIRR